MRWVPNSPSLFLAAHADGTVIVYDKEREDGSFIPQEPTSKSSSTRTNGRSAGSSTSIPSDGSGSQRDWNPLDSIFVTMPRWHPVTSTLGRNPKSEAFKNPVTHWRVSKRAIVGELCCILNSSERLRYFQDMSFSHDGKYLAIVAEDGCLRVIDAFAEQYVSCMTTTINSFY